MSFDAGSVTARFLLDDSDYQKGSKNVKKSNQSISKSFVIGQLAVQGINKALQIATQTIKKSINVARDLQEENNKINVVFSKVAKSADNMQKELQKSYGLSELASKKLLGSTGDLLTGFGFAQDSALQLSGEVQKLAVDLASFTNFSGGAEGASIALTKALLGERESIKSLGISILDVDVKTRLAAKGQDKLTGAALRQAKAQATMELALEQSKNAIGDFQRSSDSLANTQRQLGATTENLFSKIGTAFLPLVTEGTKRTLDIAKKLEKIDYSGFISKSIDAFSELQKNSFLFLDRPINRIVDYFKLDLPQGWRSFAKLVTTTGKGLKEAILNIFDPKEIKNKFEDTAFEIEKILFENEQVLKNWDKGRERHNQEILDSFDKQAEALKKRFVAVNKEIKKDTLDTAKSLQKTITRPVNEWKKGFNEIKNSAGTAADKIKMFFEGVGGELIEDITFVTKQIASAMSDIFGIVDQGLNNELAALENKHAIELEKLESQKEERLRIQEEEHIEKTEALEIQREEGLISEEEFNIRKEEIDTLHADNTAQIEKSMEAKIAASKQKARDKENAKKKEIFEANKANQIAQIWIQFALGTVAAFAQGIAQLGPIAGAIIGGVMTALLLGVAVAQTVVVSQQQFIPERAEGGRAGGLTRINEKGGEIVSLPDGSIVVPNDISRQIASNSGGMSQSNVIRIDARGAVIDSPTRINQLANVISRKLAQQLRDRT
jgi:hypothetical protein